VAAPSFTALLFRLFDSLPNLHYKFGSFLPISEDTESQQTRSDVQDFLGAVWSLIRPSLPCSLGISFSYYICILYIYIYYTNTHTHIYITNTREYLNYVFTIWLESNTSYIFHDIFSL
jgi:hypothetical protein